MFLTGETKMRPQVIIVTLAVVLGVLAALPLGKGDEEDAGASSWPCCDNCGACNKKLPPDCQCQDVSVHGCHPACKNCVKLGAGIPPGQGHGPVVTYRCADMLTNFCKRNCTPAPAPAAAAGLDGGVF